MLQPKRVKYRKVHRGRRRGSTQVGSVITFGDFGLQALESSWVTSEQIEAARRAMTRHIRRGGKVCVPHGQRLVELPTLRSTGAGAPAARSGPGRRVPEREGGLPSEVVPGVGEDHGLARWEFGLPGDLGDGVDGGPPPGPVPVRPVPARLFKIMCQIHQLKIVLYQWLNWDKILPLQM